MSYSREKSSGTPEGYRKPLYNPHQAESAQAKKYFSEMGLMMAQRLAGKRQTQPRGHSGRTEGGMERMRLNIAEKGPVEVPDRCTEESRRP